MISNIELYKFKEVLEHELKIVEWQPTVQQLQKMYDEITALTGDEEIFAVENIVHSIYKRPIKVIAVGGLNTSTAKSLLSKIEPPKNKK